MFLILVCENPKSSASLFLHDDWSTVQQPHFSHSLALVVFSLSFSFLLFPLATSDAHPLALPGHSSRRVHFERINTVPIKGQRAARRSTRRHHSLSRTLLRYGRTTPHVSQARGVARFGWVTGTHTQWFLCIFTRNDCRFGCSSHFLQKVTWCCHKTSPFFISLTLKVPTSFSVL